MHQYQQVIFMQYKIYFYLKQTPKIAIIGECGDKNDSWAFATWKHIRGKSRQTAQHKIPHRRSSNLCSISVDGISIFAFFFSGSNSRSIFSLFSTFSCRTSRFEGPGMSAISFVYVLHLLTFSAHFTSPWRHNRPIKTFAKNKQPIIFQNKVGT